jgi:hypothetical protein
LSQLGHLWKEVSARSLGLRYRPKGLPCCCRYCVLRLCAPQRYRGAFFWLAQKEKPLASVREGACQGLRSVQGHAVTEPHRKRKLRRLTVAECATNPPLVRSYLDARVARTLPQAALYGPTAVKAVPSLPVFTQRSAPSLLKRTVFSYAASSPGAHRLRDARSGHRP